MARLLICGWEVGKACGNGNWVGNDPVTSPVPGTWSTYSYGGGGGGATTFHLLWSASTGEFYCGFRYYTPTGTTNIRVLNIGSPNNVTQLCLRNDSNLWKITRGDNSATMGTGTHTVTAGVWEYVEVYGLISATVGKVQLRVNGVDDIALTTGLNTKEDGASALVDRIGFVPDNGNTYVDDVYVNDTSTAVNTAFSGDIGVKGLVVNAAGDVTGLTRGGTDSGSNWGQVDEVPPTDATDYVSGADSSSYDLYNIPAITGVFGSVQSARLWVRAQNQGPGFASIAHMVKYDSNADTVADTESQGADVPLSATWAYYGKEYNLDPAAAAWTLAKIDALQVGVKSR